MRCLKIAVDPRRDPPFNLGMGSAEIIGPDGLASIRGRLAEGDLTREDQRRLLESHVALLEAVGALVQAAQAHRTAMNPQELLDTGWVLDERIEAMEALRDEG